MCPINPAFRGKNIIDLRKAAAPAVFLMRKNRRPVMKKQTELAF